MGEDRELAFFIKRRLPSADGFVKGKFWVSFVSLGGVVKMPANLNYTQVFGLQSNARLGSISKVFNVSSDFEIYGVNVWAQHASSSIYPLMQQFEVVLRNSIDSAARARFGDFWWDKIAVDNTKPNYKSFLDYIKSAKKKLISEWKRKEMIRLGLGDISLVTTPPPALNHDDIVAATDLFTWETLLSDAYSSDNPGLKNKYLWPVSLPKVFRKLHEIDRKPNDARKKISNMITEVRRYRNRLFHHDCIWVKSKSVDPRTAVDSIREKINTIESVIRVISPVSHNALLAWGVFDNAKRVCSVDELAIYTLMNHPQPLQNESPVFNKYHGLTCSGKKTLPMMVAGELCAFYRVR